MIPRPPFENSQQGELDLPGIFFRDHFLTSSLLKQLKTWPQQKYTQQIWIRVAGYSSAEVWDSSEKPRIVGKLIFYLVKEV